MDIFGILKKNVQRKEQCEFEIVLNLQAFETKIGHSVNSIHNKIAIIRVK